MSVVIRKYKNSDHKEIISLIPRFSDFPLPEWRKAEDISNKTTKLIEESITELSEHSVLLIAEENQKVLGFALLQTRKDFFTDESHGYVSDIAVKKEVEGRGVGRLLLEAAENWSKDKGFRLLVLHVLIGNERAKRIYEKSGFQSDNIQLAKLLK
jgi:ribosomal protein S18 acetylase RimI-like enzyme